MVEFSPQEIPFGAGKCVVYWGGHGNPPLQIYSRQDNSLIAF